MARERIIFGWAISSYFGWGVYGLNLALQWARDADLLPVSACEVRPPTIAIDALRWSALEPVAAATRSLTQELSHHRGKAVILDGTVLQGLGNGMHALPTAHDTRVSGKRTIGVAFFENSTLDAAARARVAGHHFVVAGSTWNAELLSAAGVRNVVTILQGIDATLFHPAPRSNLFGDRFLIFSGGKLEYRKGQDLALLAFKAFAQCHPEAVLVTAWHCPWPEFSRSIGRNSKISTAGLIREGRLDARGWAVSNGVPADRIIDLGHVPNALMPSVLREMDVALFTNRGEAGTNLVAMEAMACGVPTILSRNTGHRDLIHDDNCIPLVRQTAVVGAEPNFGTEGWGESDVDEAVAALETAWQHRDDARRMGERGAARMAELTWPAQLSKLKTAILGNG